MRNELNFLIGAVIIDRQGDDWVYVGKTYNGDYCLREVNSEYVSVYNLNEMYEVFPF